MRELERVPRRDADERARLTPPPGDPVVGAVLRSLRDHLRLDTASVTQLVDGERVLRHGDAPDTCPAVADGGLHFTVPLRRSDGSLYGTLGGSGDEVAGGLSDQQRTAVGLLAQVIVGQIERDEQERRAARARREQLLALRPKRDLVFAAQPIHDLRGDHPRSHVVGFELLARFPTLGEGPLEVFADAWRLGVGPALEHVTIELALEALQVLPDGMHLALNLSPETLADDRATEALGTVSPGRLVVELTEHAPVADYRRLRVAIDRLRERGVRVAVDDVGTGFSGLHHIVELEPDVLKLDGALVRGVDHHPGRRAMVAAVVAFAAEVGATVVAEQVETDEELTTLRRLGVAFAQGYILGQPERLPQDPPAADTRR